VHRTSGGSTVSRWGTTHDDPFVRARAVSQTGIDDPTSSEPCSTLHLPFELSSARVARKTMSAELREWGLRESFVADAELVLAELVANGIEHGQANPDGVIEISWCIDGPVLRISVCDGGTAQTLQMPEMSDTSLRGRGLQIVDYLCAAWTVESDPYMRVTAELRMHDPVDAADH
jgi:anti-sigma regulatory factor (Ser/Thr protein kinase)